MPPEVPPSARRFLTADWRHLLMVNYVVEPELLRPWVPRGTELDTHDGLTYASLVAFRFLNTRLLGIAVPGHRDFEELNLRFYVRRETGGELRRAVVFIREVVPRAAIAWLARRIYNEPYVARPMRSAVNGMPPSVAYEWKGSTGWQRLAARAVGQGSVPAPGGLAHFITEHFWGYTAQRDGGTIEYQVEHPSWIVWSADELELPSDLPALYGTSLAAALTTPAAAFIAAGSHVVVRWPVRLA